MSDQVLPSWRDGATRDAILAFLDRVHEIPPAERVAVFDNDGTLWCEKPNYTQLEFLLVELRRAVEVDPSLADRKEYRAIIEGDRRALDDIGLVGIALALVDLQAGITPEEFSGRVATFFAEQRHPDRDVPYRQQRYRPMLELIEELRFHEFDVFIVTGGGAEFVRVVSDDIYGVKPEGIVGSQVEYDVDCLDDGSIRLLRTNRLVGTGPNEGATKTTNIMRILGRRPVVAGGNSAGDAEMLQFAMSYDGPSLALLVNHDDAEREYSYASEAGTFETDETILETAARLGWVVASIKDDWSKVFPDS